MMALPAFSLLRLPLCLLLPATIEQAKRPARSILLQVSGAATSIHRATAPAEPGLPEAPLAFVSVLFKLRRYPAPPTSLRDPENSRKKFSEFCLPHIRPAPLFPPRPDHLPYHL